MSADKIDERVFVRDEEISIPPPPRPESFDPVEAPEALEGTVPDGPTRDVPLGTILGARSGDKGGNANVGFWAQTPEAYLWMQDFLTSDRIRELYPEARDLVVDRYELPNLLSMNFVIRGLLGEGVAASLRPDPQAKMLGEELRGITVPKPQPACRPPTKKASPTGISNPPISW